MAVVTTARDAAAILAGLPDLLARLDVGVAARERRRELPHDAVAELRRSGLLSLRIPVEHGGAGGTIVDQMRAVMAIASVDSNLAQGVRPHFFFIEELRTHGTAELGARWWPRLAAGAVVGNALSEATAARPGLIASRLRRQDDGSWRLSGTKSYSTGALFADLLFISGKDDDDQDRTVLVPVDREGISLIDDWDGMGQRTTATGTTQLRDVRVEPEELVALRTLEERFTHVGGHRQLFLGAVLAGIAENAAREAAAYVRSKARPSAHGLTETATTDPYVLRAVGVISSAAFAARASVLAAAEALDRAAVSPCEQDALAASIDVARAQAAIADLVLTATQAVFDTGGASAVRDELNLHRHWRNARTVLAHNPVDYKRKVVGDWVVNATEPPRNSYF
ncbi:acyl-CoA dehydrogenase family protein [Nocardioides daeguensis]|uniref:Acyl-CoA dehydrogenase family protein n=1 Tax=Nocardioides daeguensis TaxID=908359 RepID=A0ABP6V5C1_9ACTN|nr:acyl-CoA dehydrogenase family protein [Nocardioides daeguensis]MBV6729681.1 acyl-CoA dehydrogenase family protein [Nocardioides daeguensis]MCR1774714.1 acyl-CoA dehydrogenase family protein [Nocardioides daeguensis]